MDENKRIVQLRAEMHHEQRNTNERLENVAQRIEKLEKQQAKTNPELSEIRLALMRFA